MRINFTITPEMVRLGVPDCIGCPANLALSRLLGPGHTVLVWAHKAAIDGYPVLVPPALKAWLLDFDASAHLGAALPEPGDFWVEMDDTHAAQVFAGTTGRAG